MTKQAIEIPVIEGMNPDTVAKFVKDLAQAVKAEASNNKRVSELVRTAVKDTLESKRVDLPCLMAHSLKGTPLWSRVRRALIFALGGYTVEQQKEKRLRWMDDNKSLIEYDGKQNLFILRPNTNARYEEVKAEWYAFLQGEAYTALRGKSKVATFSARQELAAFMKKLESNKGDCLPTEKQLLLDVLALLQSLDNENGE